MSTVSERTEFTSRPATTFRERQTELLEAEEQGRPTPPSPPRGPRPRRWLRRLMIIGAIAAVLLGGLGYWARGKGYAYRIRQWVHPTSTVYPSPVFTVIRPGDGSTNVPLDVLVTAEIKRARGLLVSRSAREAVRLIRTADQKVVPADVQVAGMTKLSVKPHEPLEPGTNYTFYVGEGLVDNQGGHVVPTAIGFTTAAAEDPEIRFKKVVQSASKGVGFTGVAVGPDHRLYACADDGRIFRFAIADDGTLGKPTIITSLHQAEGGPRLATGFCFDPNSPTDAPSIWVSHGWYGFKNAPDFSGKVSRMSGEDLGVVEDFVIHLPRSVRDHLTNQPSFGPDGALYIPQASNTAMGSPDKEWEFRPERLLTATILRLDPKRVTPGRPVDAFTHEGGSADTTKGASYNPFAADAPLTIYAYGVRLAYDLLWADDGHLYAAVNGSAAGGNTPSGQDIPALSEVPISEDDWFFRIAPGKYHGHPNPFHGTSILNGANPTAGYDYAEVPHYRVGTQPDPNWTPAVFDFGKHVSANGTAQYRSDTFGGKLRGAVLVCRYNVPGDLAVLRIDGSRVTEMKTRVKAFTKLLNPLDVTEDPTTGNLYVSEYGAQRITLLRPDQG